MENDQQTPVVTSTDEFVSFFALKRRDTILGVQAALALLERATRRRHKRYEDPDIFSIAVKAIEEFIPKTYVSRFLELSCVCIAKSHQHGVTTRPYRLRPGFSTQEAYERLARIFEMKSKGKPQLWKQKKSREAGRPGRPGLSSQVPENITRSNAFTVHPGMKWYDSALVAAYSGQVTYRRNGGKKVGRRYHPLQSISNEGKALSLRGTGLMDVDFSKCHPTILQFLLGGRSLALKEYLSLQHRPQRLKDDVNAVIHGLKLPKTSLGGRLNVEMRIIKAQLVKRKLMTREEARSRRGMFDLLTKYEDRALQVVEGALEKLGKEVHLLMFDGLICDPLGEAHLRWIEGEIAVTTGMNLTLAIKQTF
jgi:hypothetical protein